jgi:hypothetical protein
VPGSGQGFEFFLPILCKRNPINKDHAGLFRIMIFVHAIRRKERQSWGVKGFFWGEKFPSLTIRKKNV